MKICAIVCEYNPFHNGHAYLLNQARSSAECDAILCIMSGNFTQRGDIALLNKYDRARHAILAGADAVLELPTVFAISPAEIFAKGAIKLLQAIPGFTHLAFGCENNASISFFTEAAQATMQESEGFRSRLRIHLKNGKSLTKAREASLAECGNPAIAELLRLPNNILGVEYQKALLSEHSNASILPIPRTGATHREKNMRANYSSATALREALQANNLRAVRKNVPAFVFDDLPQRTDPTIFYALAVYSVLSKSGNDLKRILDCTEGLENRLKAFAKGNPDYETLIQKTTTKRYISSRIRRILAAATLDISEDLVRRGLRSILYLKPLAIRKEKADALLSVLGKSAFPLLTRKADYSKLTKTGAEIYQKDLLASDIYALVCGHTTNENRLHLI